MAGTTMLPLQMVLNSTRCHRDCRRYAKRRLDCLWTAALLFLLGAGAALAQEAFLLRALNVELRVLDHPGDIPSSVAFSPNGALLATGGTAGSIALWDVQTDSVLHILETGDGDVHALDFSPDGLRLASGHSSGSLYIFDVERGLAKQRFTDHGGAVTSVAFSPDGRFLVAGSNNEVWVRSGPTGGKIRVFREHQSPVSALAFSPDGRRVASGDDDGSILVWNPDTGDRFHTSSGSRGKISDLAFSSNGRFVISGTTDIGVRLTAVGTSEEARMLDEHASPVLSVAPARLPSVDSLFASNTNILADAVPFVVVGYADGSLFGWSTETAEVVHQFPASALPVTSVSFSPDGSLLASVSGTDVVLRNWPTPESYRAYAVVAHERPDLFRPKGEFEPTSSYQSRQLQARETFQAALDALASGEPLDDIAPPATTVALSIDDVGPYDADSETFPITIGDQTGDIQVPLSEAPTFKDRWREAEVRGIRTLRGDLLTVDTVNVQIAHPTTGSVYPFGVQEDVAGVRAAFDPNEVRAGGQAVPRATSSASSSPPVLSIYASFSEPSRNDKLDAGEQGMVDLVIRNVGEGEARGLRPRLALRNDVPGVELGPVATIASLPPGGSEFLSVPVTAALDVQDSVAHVTIEVSEANGHDFSPPAIVSFDVAAALATATAELALACEGALSHAESSFYESRFDEAIEALTPCLSAESFRGREREHAYAMLSKVHLKRGAKEEAVASLRTLLTMATDYEPDPLREPPDFVALVEEVRQELEREAARTPIDKVTPLGPDGAVPTDSIIVAPAPVERRPSPASTGGQNDERDRQQR